MKYYRALRLFFSIVWRDWCGTISIRAAWNVAKLIWLSNPEDKQETLFDNHKQ